MASEASTANRNGNLRSDQTKEKLILAAERLMGERGIEAVALREITAAAGQRNSNVIQYHFGDRLGLLDAIFEYRARQIDPIRRAMMEDAAQKGRLDDVKTLLRLAMEPEFVIYRREGTLDYVRLMVHYMLYLRPRGVPHPFDRNSPWSMSLHEVFALLHKRLSHLPAARFYFRTSILDTMLFSTLLAISQRQEEGEEPLEVLLEDTLEMMAAAICAPPWFGSVADRIT